MDNITYPAEYPASEPRLILAFVSAAVGIGALVGVGVLLLTHGLNALFGG